MSESKKPQSSTPRTSMPRPKVVNKFLADLEKSPVTVNHACLNEIKVALDDTLIKLVINAIGGVVALYAYLKPFDETIFFVGMGCAIFILCPEEIYHGKKSDLTISVNTKIIPPSTMYHVYVTKKNKNDAPGQKPVEFKKPVEAWFDEKGVLCGEVFQADVKAWLDTLSEKSE